VKEWCRAWKLALIERDDESWIERTMAIDQIATRHVVVPAKAGIQGRALGGGPWFPVAAGMTGN
jgi:hypothetical protein